MNCLTALFVGEPLRTAALDPNLNLADIIWKQSDGDLYATLAAHRPRVIVTAGQLDDYQTLLHAPFDVRRRWLHYPEQLPADLYAALLGCFSADVLTRRAETPPLVSVFTPTYNTGSLLFRAYQSLLAQTYSEWEWVVLDDSSEPETWALLLGIAADDPRVSIHRGTRSGVIGELKAKLCGLCRGDVLAELDHDDELTPTALAMTVEALRAHPDSGFAYTDWCEVFEDGGNASYPAGWAFGYGEEVSEEYRGRVVLTKRTPPINALTARHIVSAPNHLRAWRRDFYHQIGGHNRLLHVADDYELCVRSFLHTRPVHVKALGYIQYMSRQGRNTQRVRNAEIQRLTNQIWLANDRAIHERLLQLGLPDPLWSEQHQHGDFAAYEQHARLQEAANYVFVPGTPSPIESLPSIVDPCESTGPGAEPAE